MAKRRMRFGTWCLKDINDETKIVYTFHTYDGQILYFTSDDDCAYSFLRRLYDSWILKIERVRNELSDHWFAELYEEGAKI